MPPERQFWQIDTEKLASDLGRVVRRSHTEEDFKMGAEPLIKRAFDNLGVDVDVVRYEKATGFRAKRNLADVVYGYLVIEYKAPGKLRRPATLKESKEQLERYLSGEAERYGAHKEDALQKMVGFSLDGEQILFARFSRTARIILPPVPILGIQQTQLFPSEPAPRGFQFLGPYPVNASSLTNLLIFARAAARRPLTAQDLAQVFGPNHTVAQQALSELYSAVMRAQRRKGPSRVKTFFQEWDRLFGVVYGQELEKAEPTAEETARLYQMPGGVRLKQFLFAIHTYYAFLMKLIAVELLAMQRESTVEAFVAQLPALDDDGLRERLNHLESGYAFSARGIENFLEADFFSWYLDSWTGALAEAIRGIVRALAEFEPATPVLEPQWTQDLLQKLYELIVPQKLRHDLGEYYTPGWLAGYLVDKAGYIGAKSRFLDPACGSGTFLVQAIHRAIRDAESQPRARPAETARSILDNIIGFDLNPLAVLAARTNYLIAFSRFIPYIRPISIPVYLCDSVVPPDKSRDPQQSLYDNDVVVFTTTVRDYIFPISIPLPVVEWKRKPGVGRVQPDWSLEEVLEKTARANFQAIPVDPGKPTSSWQTARRADLRASEVLKGTNPYKARLGARVEPYGVFWLRIKEVRPDDKLVIENLHDRGKRKVPLVSTTIESDLVYPAVSGGDLVRFGVQSHFYVLISQDPAARGPYPESWMLDHAPLTHAYLKPFEQILLSRGSKVVRQFAEKTEFYAMYGIGEYTFATYRVTWKRMASKMSALVLSTLPTSFGRKTAISTDTTSFMVARNRGEAHYLCAILNSDIVDGFIRSYSAAGRGFGAPSVMENLAIPQFNSENRLHNRLADLSLEAHTLVARGRDISGQEAQINEAVRRLWNIRS